MQSFSEFQLEWTRRWQDMTNYIYYNQMTDWRIAELNKQLKIERNRTHNAYRQKAAIKRDHDTMQNNNLETRKALLNLLDLIEKTKEKKDEPPQKKATHRRNLILIPPNEYQHIDQADTDKELREVFNNISSINDIIDLKNHQHKYDLTQNDKFKRLYNIIPDLKLLDNLVGMDQVKAMVFEHICYFVQNLNNKNELMHIVITGPPGVGKTELGKIIGKLYFSLGFLENDTFMMARRSDLIGEYLGHTAVKTQKRIDEAIGGVLFIDEVYSLGHPEKQDSFSKECIDTINQNLTENKGKFLCIIAGYKDDIERSFFAFNKGLERRFPIRYNINSYSAEELHEIFQRKMTIDNWTADPQSLTFFKQYHKEMKYYGGDVELIIQRAKFVAGKRMMKTLLDTTPEYRLTNEDLKDAISQIMKDRIKNDDLPFGMYT